MDRSCASSVVVNERLMGAGTSSMPASSSAVASTTKGLHMNNRTIRRLAVLLAGAVAAPVAASLPTPAPAAASTDSMAYLHHAGSGDVFEITTSMLALQKSQNSQLRDFATMLIDHHTQLTNAALVAAKAGAVMPPPPNSAPNRNPKWGNLSQPVRPTSTGCSSSSSLPRTRWRNNSPAGMRAGATTPLFGKRRRAPSR